ncbi:MAG: glycerophosphodiester phosphodiesterase [Candidatus Thorarchaeota archaeon]
MFLIGHRGTRLDFDENTIEAFKIALKFGAKIIEFDVRKLKDDNLVIFHNHSLERTTNSNGLLKNFTYQEIKTIKTKKRERKIPLLSEVFEFFKGKCKFLIDLKDEGIFEDIINLINNYDLLDDCIFSGRNLKELMMIKHQLPKTQVCYNITKGRDLSLSEFSKLASNGSLIFKPDLISLKSNLIDLIFIQTCHKNNIMVLAWNFINYSNPIKVIKDIIKMGINGILFDNYKNISLIKKWI